MSENKSRLYRKSAKALVGKRGAVLRTTREYHEPLPHKKSTDVLDTGTTASKKLTRPRKGTQVWSSDLQQDFLDWVALANFDPIMETGVDSTMVTLKYTGIDESRWKNLWSWTKHYSKHIERLYKMGVAAWGPDFAFAAHFEFETEHGQRPHWHVWLAPRRGKSNYKIPSRYAHEKAGVNNLVFWRWLEAAWSTILDVEFDVNNPVRTWVASQQEMTDLYGQDEYTPMRISRYWLKQGNSPEMVAKRRQLKPCDEWIERGVRFKYVVSFGLSMDYIEIDDLSPEAEAAFREEVSKGIDPVLDICGDTGSIRNTTRLSPDASQGGRQYEVFTEERRASILKAVLC